MSRKALFPWLAGIFCLLVAGCGGVSVSVLFFDDHHRDQVQDLPFQEVTPVIPSAIADRRLLVVRDLVAWDALWREHAARMTPPPAMPAINFSQNMVIAVFLGKRGPGCHQAQIQAITQHTHPDRIEVNFREISTTSPTVCGDSNPATLVILPFSHFPVEFFQVR